MVRSSVSIQAVVPYPMFESAHTKHVSVIVSVSSSARPVILDTLLRTCQYIIIESQRFPDDIPLRWFSLEWVTSPFCTQKSVQKQAYVSEGTVCISRPVTLGEKKTGAIATPRSNLNLLSSL